MDYANSLQCGWFAIHLLGLLAAVSMRVYAGSRAEPSLQGVYLCCLAAVAVAALAGRQFCWPLLSFSAGTLAIMIVCAVAELGVRRVEVAPEAA